MGRKKSDQDPKPVQTTEPIVEPVLEPSADPVIEDEAKDDTEHITVEDPGKPVDESDPAPLTDEEVEAIGNPFTPDESFKPNEVDSPDPTTEEDPDQEKEIQQDPPTEETPTVPEEQKDPDPKPDPDPDPEPEPEQPLFVSDNGVLPAQVITGQQFVVGLSRKLPIGTKIKSGSKTFLVHWANDAHKSLLNNRRDAHQTLISLEGSSRKPINTSDFFAEKSEFEVL